MFNRNLEELLMQVPHGLQQAFRNELREQQRMDAIETVKCRYNKESYSKGAGEFARKRNAELLGLTAIGRDSAFASLVAVHPNFDDMVLKVVEWADAGAWYARAIRDGKINSIHAPKVFAVHNIDGQAFIYMERLIDVNDFPEDCKERIGEYNDYLRGYCFYSGEGRIPDSLKDYNEQFKAWNSSTGYNVYGNKGFPTDFHTGNVMLRPDGTAVFIDPIHSAMKTPSQKLAEQLELPGEVDNFFILPDAADITPMPMPRLERENRILGNNPFSGFDFGEIEKAVVVPMEPRPVNKQQRICKGKPHVVFIDHNIKGFKRK